ncbi:GDSL esterase/lipase At1g74460 [Fagus crenata]
MNFPVILTIIVTVLGIAIDGYNCKTVQFIFGDSLSDVGNNKNLNRSLAQANLPWYGIDFGNGLPNGRFSNGRTVADIIGDKTGLPRPPAFLDPSLTEDIILENGVNYASGGGGILNETGSLFIQRFSLSKQIELFEGTIQMITAKIGKAEADKFFQGSKYVVALGSNDFINNYLMPVYGDSWTYNDKTFIEYLMETLRVQLKHLHTLGARQLIAFGLGPVGCIPLQRVLSSTGNCQDKANNLALSFNKASSKLLDDLSTELPNATFRFGEAYDVVNEVINNPQKYGFDNADAPCCSFYNIRPALTCVPASSLCKDRSKYVFWDEYHPTDSANELIANELIKKFGLSSVDGPSPAPATTPSSPAPAITPSRAPAKAPSRRLPPKTPSPASDIAPSPEG